MDFAQYPAKSASNYSSSFSFFLSLVLPAFMRDLHSNHGASFMEAAIGLLLFITMVLFLFDLARYFTTKLVMN